MQVVLAQRMSIPFQAPAVNLYRALRSLNPSPYMYFMHLDDFQIVSSSPEILARLENGVITNRPLAGTRRRGHDEAEDLTLEAELKADPKEIAEHLMLIDLGRNDMGRVSAPGSVEVTEQFVIERYSHVMHLSSNVTGTLLPGKTAVIKGGKLYIQAGGGIVHDSVPRLEWKESLNKGRAIFRAAALAENQLTDPNNEQR